MQHSVEIGQLEETGRHDGRAVMRLASELREV